MNKKADVWVSAIIYIGVGMTIITILLAAGLPVINKIKDKNSIEQTKATMTNLDDTIRQLMKEPGGRRTSIMKITKGEFTIISNDSTDTTTSQNHNDNKIRWILKGTKIMASQPGETAGSAGTTVDEGNLEITTTKSQVEGEYEIELLLDYEGLLYLDSAVNTLSGTYNLMISNEGAGKIKISEITQ